MKFGAGIHRDQLGAQLLAERRRHLFALVLAQQARIHKHRHQLVADGLMHQRRGHGRIHAAADRRQHAFIAHLLAYASTPPLQ